MTMLNELYVEVDLNFASLIPTIVPVYRVGLSWHFGFMPQGNTWKTHRRIFANDFNSASVSQFRPHQLKWRDIFLGNLLKTPNDFETHIQQ